MTCKQVELILAEDIRAVEQAEVQDHIRCCGDCEKLYRDLLSMEEISRLLGETAQAPTDFSSRVHQRLAESSGWQLFWRPVFVVGLLILISAGFLWVRVVQTTDEPVLAARPIVQEDESRSERLVNVSQRVEPRQAPDPYVEVILSSPSQPEYILRLPSRINIRTTHLHHDFYLEHASY